MNPRKAFKFTGIGEDRARIQNLLQKSGTDPNLIFEMQSQIQIKNCYEKFDPKKSFESRTLATSIDFVTKGEIKTYHKTEGYGE
jgi:hypothetical protein